MQLSIMPRNPAGGPLAQSAPVRPGFLHRRNRGANRVEASHAGDGPTPAQPRAFAAEAFAIAERAGNISCPYSVRA